jgi:hypothetical protein
MLVKYKKQCEIIPPLRLNNDLYVFTDKEKANALNDCFVSVSSVDDSNSSLPILNLKTN